MNFFERDVTKIREYIKKQLNEKLTQKLQGNTVNTLMFSELELPQHSKYACIEKCIEANTLSKLAIYAPRHSGLTIQLLDYCKNKMEESPDNIIFYVGRDCSESIISYIQRKYLNFNDLLKNKNGFNGFSHFKGMCQDEQITIVIEDFDNPQVDFKKLIDEEILKDVNIIVRTSNSDIDLISFTKVCAIGVNLKIVKELIQSEQINLVFAKCFKEELRWPHALIHLKELKSDIDSNTEIFKKIEEELKGKIGADERTTLSKVINYILPELCITGNSLNQTNLMHTFRKIVDEGKATGDDYLNDFIHDNFDLGHLTNHEIYEKLFYEPVIKQMGLMTGDDTYEPRYEWVKESDGDYFYAKGFFNRILRKKNNSNSIEDVDKLETDLADKLIDAEDTTKNEKPTLLIKYFRRVMFLKYMLEKYKGFNDVIAKFPVIIAKLYCGIAEFYEFVGEEDKKYESATMALDLLKENPSDLAVKLGIQYEELQSGMAYYIIKYKRKRLKGEESSKYDKYLLSAKEVLENAEKSVEGYIALKKKAGVFNDDYTSGELILSKIYGNLGAYYYNQKDYANAKKYHKKSLKIKEELLDQIEKKSTTENIENKIRIGIIRSNICIASDFFWEKTDNGYEQSVKFHEKSIELGDKWTLLVSLPSYSRIAGCLIESANKSSATDNTKKILKYLSAGMEKMGIPIDKEEIDYISAEWIVNRAELVEIQKKCKDVKIIIGEKDYEIKRLAEKIINQCQQILLE